jgi:hypothetical protein
MIATPVGVLGDGLHRAGVVGGIGWAAPAGTGLAVSSAANWWVGSMLLQVACLPEALDPASVVSSPPCGYVGESEKHEKRRIVMPEFGSPFSGLANDRKLTDEELIRSVRFMVAAEYEATQLYTQLAESTDNKLAILVLRDIADEERVHAGEFLRLLHELAPDEEKFYARGAKEVEAMIRETK